MKIFRLTFTLMLVLSFIPYPGQVFVEITLKIMAMKTLKRLPVFHPKNKVPGHFLFDKQLS